MGIPKIRLGNTLFCILLTSITFLGVALVFISQSKLSLNKQFPQHENAKQNHSQSPSAQTDNANSTKQLGCNQQSIHLLDTDILLPCDWKVSYISNEIRILNEQELKQYVKSYTQKEYWPIAKKLTIKLSKEQTTLTFEKNYYFLPEGFGGMPSRIKGPLVAIYKSEDPKGINLVRVKTNKNTYTYYPAEYWEEGPEGEGYYHIGINLPSGQEPIKITLQNSTTKDLKEIDQLIKTICIDKGSRLCELEP